MIAELPLWTQGAARDLGVIAVLIGSLGVIAKTRIGRTVGGLVRRTYRRAFGQPVTSWAAGLVTAAVKPMIDALSDRNDQQHAETAEQLTDVRKRVAVVEANTEIHAERLDRGAERMDGIIVQLDQLATDVQALRAPTLPFPKQEAS